MKNTSFLMEPLDVTIESQKFLSCVARFQQRKESFGISYTVKVLCGSYYLEAGHQDLSTYGIGKDKGKTFWNNLYCLLLERGLIDVEYIQVTNATKRELLRFNTNSWEILKGNLSVIIKSKSWKIKLADSQELQVSERGFPHTLQNKETYTCDYDDDFPQNEEAFMINPYDTYDSFLTDNDLDYGYLSDMDNYNAY